VLVVEDGTVVSLGAGRPPSVVGRARAGRIAAFAGIEIPDTVLCERHALSRAGVLHVSVVLDPKGRLAKEPVVFCRGVLEDEQVPSAVRFIALEVAKSLDGRRSPKDPGDAAIAEAARFAARRAVETRTGRKPVTSATVGRLPP
jgi:ribonuclease J